MKKLHTILLISIVLCLIACNKETATTQTDVMNNLLVNKIWYLDYSITGNNSKSYVGQSTYFVTYLKDGLTRDSDGLIGNYTVEIVNNQSQIHIMMKTINGNSFELIYDIISVGNTKLVLSKQIVSGTPTQLFFTSK